MAQDSGGQAQFVSFIARRPLVWQVGDSFVTEKPMFAILS